ncbi:MAG: nucleotidyltransferase family protein [Wenzhouxiangella sp.]
MAIQLESVELTPEGRLLLLVARDVLEPLHEQLLAEYASGVRDWRLFVQRCSEHFILPIALRHLRILPPEIVPQEVLGELRDRAFKVVVRSLQIAAVQRRLSESVLEESGVRHVFVKGQALAGRYYQEPAARFCRDVDVLVDKRDLAHVGRIAQQCGFSVYPDLRQMNSRDLAAVAKYRPVITLKSQEGVLIEVHSELDKTALIFDTNELLLTAERFSLHGSGLMCLPTTQHFVFVCLHSTRHLWSHLSWLVDLDAMIRAPDFDQKQALCFAENCGVRSTVEACLELHREWHSGRPARSRLGMQARDLFDSIRMHVAAGPGIEFKLRESRPLPDFSFEWQASKKYKARARWQMLFSGLQPNFKDYEAFPLPEYLQWVYFLTRPFSGLRRRRCRDSVRGQTDT